MLLYGIFSQAITYANAAGYPKPGGGKKCKDKYDEEKCKELMEAGKCEDKKVVKKCMKTCEACEDDGSGEGNKKNSGKFVKFRKNILFVIITIYKNLGGKCKDKLDYKKCKKIMEAGKCEDDKYAKKCKKTCDMCEDEGPKKSMYSADRQ